MHTDELEKRQHRARRTEQFIIRKTDTGYRVCSSLSPANQYVVSGLPYHPQCTCPDFTSHAADPDWRCKHLLAVLEKFGSDESPVVTGRNGRAPQPIPAAASPDGDPNIMVIKRSVSPDGKIDSLSVELSLPVNMAEADATTRHAGEAIVLQTAIVESFLKRSRQIPSKRQANGHVHGGLTPAQLTRVGGMDSRYGRRLFINVAANNSTLKLFGTARQLQAAITKVGYPDRAVGIAEGMELHLPCLITTEPSADGRYTNIKEVFPVNGNARNGG